MKNTNYEFDFNNNYNYYLIWESDEPYLEKNLILFSYSFTHEYIIKLNKEQLRKLINEMLIELVGDKSAELQGQ
jgi:predicted amidophosphoribosyltransferase